MHRIYGSFLTWLTLSGTPRPPEESTLLLPFLPFRVEGYQRKAWHTRVGRELVLRPKHTMIWCVLQNYGNCSVSNWKLMQSNTPQKWSAKATTCPFGGVLVIVIMKTECYSDLKSKDMGGKSMLWVRWVRMYHPGTIYIRSTLGSA